MSASMSDLCVSVGLFAGLFFSVSPLCLCLFSVCLLGCKWEVEKTLVAACIDQRSNIDRLVKDVIYKYKYKDKDKYKYKYKDKVYRPKIQY